MEEKEREGSGKVLHATRPLERVEREGGGGWPVNRKAVVKS